MKKLIILLLVIYINFLPGCNGEENSMSLNKIGKEKIRVQKEYTEMLDNHKDELLDIFNWFQKNYNYFYLTTRKTNYEVYIETNEGVGYIQNDNVELLLLIMKEFNLNDIIYDTTYSDVTFERTVVEDDLYVFHRLIYHTGDLDPETQHSYVELSDNFYYHYSVGE
jgi:hypothetical protein